MAAALSSEPLQPSEEISALAADASQRLLRVIGVEGQTTCVVRFESAPDEPITLPVPAVRLLGAVLAELAKGHAITLTPHPVVLTIEEAADLLNVSRALLESLLDRGELPHHEVGSHRRVRFSDLMAYKRRHDAESEAALRELEAISQEIKRDT